MQIPEKLLAAIENYLAGRAGPEERRLVDEWYRSFDDGRAEITEEGDDTADALRDRIGRRLAQTIRRESPARRAPRRWAVPAAAAALLLLAGAAWWLTAGEPRKAIIARAAAAAPAPAAPILPGADKAVLTLANGTAIVLDSAAGGLIGTQGGVAIEKKSGAVNYARGSWQARDDNALYNTIATPRGGQYAVTLGDGTRVWLNAASSIRFPVAFAGAERRVEITGEAYFEVAENAAKPFYVKAAGTEVQVLGTHFNINAYDDEALVRTTLIQGKVKVSATKGGASRYLLPGQQSAVGANGAIAVSDNADLEEALAWKNGLFLFKSAGIRHIMRQLSRWYDVDVEYKGDADLHFTGQVSRNSDVSKVLEKLTLTGEVRLRIDGRKIIVSH